MYANGQVCIEFKITMKIMKVRRWSRCRSKNTIDETIIFIGLKTSVLASLKGLSNLILLSSPVLKKVFFQRPVSRQRIHFGLMFICTFACLSVFSISHKSLSIWSGNNRRRENKKLSKSSRPNLS